MANRSSSTAFPLHKPYTSSWRSPCLQVVFPLAPVRPVGSHNPHVIPIQVGSKQDVERLTRRSSQYQIAGKVLVSRVRFYYLVTVEEPRTASRGMNRPSRRMFTGYVHRTRRFRTHSRIKRKGSTGNFRSGIFMAG